MDGLDGKEAFSRSAALLGATAMERLASAHVLLVGVGGVGSWCAEALVRTGLGRLTMMDDDVVAESNLNRQCPATVETVGRPKVEAMRDRLLSVNPGCRVEALNGRFGTDSELVPELSPDLVVDAIDSVDCKAALILSAAECGVPIVSSMGAALRTDPAQVRVTRFGKVEGDGLAKALRRRFKTWRRYPPSGFRCVWSGEPAVRLRAEPGAAAVKGSIMPVTAAFGMCLAAEAMKILTKGQTGK